MIGFVTCSFSLFIPHSSKGRSKSSLYSIRFLDTSCIKNTLAGDRLKYDI